MRIFQEKIRKKHPDFIYKLIFLTDGVCRKYSEKLAKMEGLFFSVVLHHVRVLLRSDCSPAAHGCIPEHFRITSNDGDLIARMTMNA